MSDTEKRAQRNEAPRIATRMVQTAMGVYATTGERAALRCALSDAAALCDALARDIKQNNRSKRGRPTTRALDLAVIAELCGNAIWAMREQVTFPAQHDTQADLSSDVGTNPPSKSRGESR